MQAAIMMRLISRAFQRKRSIVSPVISIRSGIYGVGSLHWQSRYLQVTSVFLVSPRSVAVLRAAKIPALRIHQFMLYT